MKTKSRNLLTVLLAMLCAVAVAIGVSFALPKNNTKTAIAAVAKNAVTYAQVSAKQHWVSSSSTNADTNYAGLQTANTSYGYANFSGSTVSVRKNASRDNTLYYVEYSASITVPALTEYKVAFTCKINVTRITNVESYIVYDYLYFGDTNRSSSISRFGVNTTGSTYSRRNGVLSSAGPVNVTDTVTETFTNNDPINAQTFTVYFGYFAGTGRNLSTAYGFTSTAVMSETVTVKSIDASVDKTSVTFNNQNQNFTFSYDKDRSLLTKATYLPVIGSETTLYEYNLATSSVVSGSDPLSSTGVMTVKNAGTYTLYFDIKPNCGAVWDSTTEDQSTKVIIFKIEPKKLIVPTVQNATQTYDPVYGSHFGVDSNFDPATMTATNVTTGITWNSASTCFDATNAGTYQVKF